ncbi:flavodoxin domain-containing protein [Terrisporobacter sp.]|uniref:flavodoxin domain-containing protein n=1 Tax=Terrisporobacter sp. TaxID=1965305 RepID=UPI00260F9368|nr:flavodoxin domain-containing protein [Terrisporobacter sp.]
MDNIIVIYKSKYGSTKRYAQYLSKKLNCNLLEESKVNKDTLDKYNTIIYGGGIYAGRINGLRTIINNYENIKYKNVIVYTVGITNPNDKKTYDDLIKRNFTEDMITKIQVFNLLGDINYSKLNFFNKIMMYALIGFIKKKDESKRTDDDKKILESYGKSLILFNEKSIKPIINHIKTL